ncbi:molybdenum cofactor biosynthesis protein MoaE [Isachenkonia alkalipeptolytica]|uniref:Molybdopterin biosynthesis protein n=1 Tax=Isachenkonia alkalipeptolytica TaxID=2565777 RepID=A0AA43XLG9_9CLOT|nr:molybdenum cofactor biosynthesis protein MoaE [Isachenkonia alkalipeptolytica]NBG88429.1 molybdopterin biosynthesis protein [Isachenkonia alkalipeptolytica]
MNHKQKKAPPSMDEWLKEVKKGPEAHEEGMYLVHNGVVRKTPKIKVRQGIDEGRIINKLEFSYDSEKVLKVIEETKELEGIFHVKVWLNEGVLEVGDDIMFVLIGGDIRPRVIDALQFAVGKIKNECVTEIEISDSKHQ